MVTLRLLRSDSEPTPVQPRHRTADIERAYIEGLKDRMDLNYYAYGRPNLLSTYSYSSGGGGTVCSNPNVSAYNFLLGLGYRF